MVLALSRIKLDARHEKKKGALRRKAAPLFVGNGFEAILGDVARIDIRFYSHGYEISISLVLRQESK